MASNQVVENTLRVGHTRDLSFAGDGVLLSGQIDYPTTPPSTSGYPLLFILHHAGCNARSCYDPHAQAALEVGYAVFRWDKRGTGRSGAGGRGSTTQDAVNAYEVALDQAQINLRRVVLMAIGSGTGLIGSSFGLFARVQPPYGVILASNQLDERAILAIDTRLQIIVGQEDWNPWQKFAKKACAAHNAAYKYGATYYVAPQADRMLYDERTGGQMLHFGVRKVMQDWLRSLNPTFTLI